jgi:hypothetical protein
VEPARELAPQLALVAALLFVTRARPGAPRLDRPAAFFLLLALASSLPFLFIPRQSGRYLIQAYPLFALALAFAAAQPAADLDHWVETCAPLRRRLRLVGASLVALSIAVMPLRAGAVTRYREFYEDIYLQHLPIQPRTIVSVPDPVLSGRLYKQAQRYLRVSLANEWGHPYAIVAADAEVDVPQEYVQINQPVNGLRVFEHRGAKAGPFSDRLAVTRRYGASSTRHEAAALDRRAAH